jgi:hypothetical protein
MEQLGNLLTAMIAVIVSGSSDLLVESEPTAKGARPQSTGYISVPKEIHRQFFGAGKCKGLISAVALETQRPKQVVTGVLHGRMGSQIIADALIRGISERVGSEAALLITPAEQPIPTSALSQEELEEFRNRGRYFGLMGDVAEQFGTRIGTVSSVAHGKLKSKKILAALRTGMNTYTSGPKAGRPPQKKVVHFSEEVILQFTCGKYRGSLVRIARALCVGRSRVSEVLHGRGQSRRIVAALKSEITRIDAEHSAKKGGA